MINKKCFFLCFAVFFLLLSCFQSSKEMDWKNGSRITNNDSLSNIQVELKSSLRPNEKLQLGTVNTDIVKYVSYDDNGDNSLVFVEKDQDTIGLITFGEKPDHIRGEEIEIQWKIDSIRYAGDSEFLDYTEFVISTKTLKPLTLANKKVKVLWRETQYSEEYKTDINNIVLNDEYIKTISEPEKAALAYIATFIGNECEWDGKASTTRSNLKCKILWSLGLGYQCSFTHLEFLRFWFRYNPEILKELENCPTTPEGATVQDTFDEIDMEIKDNKIVLYFKASGFNMRESKSWSWSETHYYDFIDNELNLIKKEKSPVERKIVEVSGN